MKKMISISVVLAILFLAVTLVYAAQNWATESVASIQKGWNLVYGFISPDQLEGQAFSSSHIKAIYAFVPQNQKYIRLYPNPVEKENVINQLSQQAFWVYSDAAPKGSLNSVYNAMEYWLYNFPVSFEQRKLYKGWNFVAITTDMYNGEYNPGYGNVGEYFSWDAIKGDCNYEKIYFWHPEKQSWYAMASDLQLKSYDFDDFLGNGMLVKVSKDCNLKKLTTSENISPPALP